MQLVSRCWIYMSAASDNSHCAGTQLLLSMADAKGGAGGMSTPLFTVAGKLTHVFTLSFKLRA